MSQLIDVCIELKGVGCLLDQLKPAHTELYEWLGLDASKAALVIRAEHDPMITLSANVCCLGQKFLYRMDEWLPVLSKRYPLVLVISSWEADFMYAPSAIAAYFGGHKLADAGGDCEHMWE